MLALESARTRLSVAIAVESKSTPRARWLCYLDTTDQISRLIKQVRNSDFAALQDSQLWIRALDRIERLPIQSQAAQLCQILRDIVSELE